MEALDLFSAAAGGWSLGLHRAGLRTIAACEIVPWRRALYAENNPDVRIYDDVQTLTADQLVRDLGRLPSLIVGSPPCQDISSANTNGKGVDGARSRLFFEAVRLVAECRPRWFALENSANLRTRGADRILGALEDLGYTVWPFVVRACDVGANHERPRCWIIGCDADQLTSDPLPGLLDRTGALHAGGTTSDTCIVGCQPRRAPVEVEASEPVSIERGVGDVDRYRGRIVPSASDAVSQGHPFWQSQRRDLGAAAGTALERNPPSGIARTDADHDRQRYGTLHAEMEERGLADGDAREPWAGWNGGLAHHLRVDDGLSARLAGTSVVLGSRSRKSAANLLVEAFGDAVVPQIPEAIGRAILRTERAYALVNGAQ